jgi:glycosyltransferase involved in cell wall biosynthesis
MTSISAARIDGPAAARVLPVAALLPAYQPTGALVDVVKALAGSGFTAIIVLDDGSGPEYAAIFDELQLLDGVRVIRHAVNLGKGAALKTGMNYALVEFPDLAGVVTADADGQHDPADIRRVARRFAESPDALVLGARTFAGEVPLRSRFGNWITRKAMRLAVGHRLSDTQTGLRAVPRGLMERMLSVSASGYDFELEMLVAAKHLGVEVAEEPIQTIYASGNPTSHFEPLRDSMRIYFVLLRFAFISMLTAVLDNLAFYLFFSASGAVPWAMLGARLTGVGVQLHRGPQGRFSFRGAAPGCSAPLSLVGRGEPGRRVRVDCVSDPDFFAWRDSG